MVATINTVAGAATLERFPQGHREEPAPTGCCSPRLTLPHPSPLLLQRFEALNPAASIDDAATVVPPALLFGGVKAVAARPRFM